MGMMFNSTVGQIVPVIFPEHGRIDSVILEVIPAHKTINGVPRVIVCAGNLMGGYSCPMDIIDGVLYSFPRDGKAVHEVDGPLFTVWDPKTDW